MGRGLMSLAASGKKIHLSPIVGVLMVRGLPPCGEGGGSRASWLGSCSSSLWVCDTSAALYLLQHPRGSICVSAPDCYRGPCPPQTCKYVSMAVDLLWLPPTPPHPPHPPLLAGDKSSDHVIAKLITIYPHRGPDTGDRCGGLWLVEMLLVSCVRRRWGG